MSSVIYAPHYTDFGRGHPSVFLAGSIEMGKADDWQTAVTNRLSGLNCVLFNPRRRDWDSSWKQEKTNPQFRQQVQWELEHLDKVDIIALWLAPGTVSPISLLEFGLHLRRGNMVIGCPVGFERKGNIDITAERYGVPVCEDFDTFLNQLGKTIRGHYLYVEPVIL